MYNLNAYRTQVNRQVKWNFLIGATNCVSVFKCFLIELRSLTFIENFTWKTENMRNSRFL